MCNGFTQEQLCLINRIRLLWSQHVYRTRFTIISTAENLGDLKPVSNRLMQNPNDFAQLLTPFYGVRRADKFRELFTQHLLIADELVNAAKNSDTAKADDARKRWYENADEIADFLSCINRYWSYTKWKEMMFSHLEMTEEEASLRLSGKYEADIKMFDSIENEALKMADYMSCGIIKQCFRR